MNGKFAALMAISTGEATAPLPAKPLIGTIKGFSRFQHDRYGMQETVIVELESGELVSAILTPYLIDGMRRQNAEENDLVLIQLLGKDISTHGNSFNKYNLVVQKT